MRKLTPLVSGFVAAVLAAALAVPGAAHAEPSPVHDPALAECTDPLVTFLYANTAWRHKDLRIAWAIAMRESGGDETLVTGEDQGLFQLNEPGWGDTEYWPADPLNGVDNANSAYAMWEDYSFIPWGHDADGSTNAKHYPNWTKKQIYRMITKPFRDNYRSFPDSCKPYLKLN